MGEPSPVRTIEANRREGAHTRTRANRMREFECRVYLVAFELVLFDPVSFDFADRITRKRGGRTTCASFPMQNP